MQGVYAPQHREVLSSALNVIGDVPKELDGVYIRTGPNPQHEPHGGYIMCALSHCLVVGSACLVSYC
jgi:carotenoid cleavage dioxygenase-like enzyme